MTRVIIACVTIPVLFLVGWTVGHSQRPTVTRATQPAALIRGAEARESVAVPAPPPPARLPGLSIPKPPKPTSTVAVKAATSERPVVAGSPSRVGTTGGSSGERPVQSQSSAQHSTSSSSAAKHSSSSSPPGGGISGS